MKKLLLFLIIVFSAGAVFFAWRVGKKETFPERFFKKTAVTPTVGPKKEAIATISPQEFAENQLKEAFSRKYGKPVEQIILEIKKFVDPYASGGVRFEGETGGGWFLAYHDKGGWFVVDDGNGTVSCEAIWPYNFPKEMVSECVNAAGKLIKR